MAPVPKVPLLLKVFEQPRKFQQVIHAYQNWLSQLSQVPELLQTFNTPKLAIAITEVPGSPNPQGGTAELHRAAGGFCDDCMPSPIPIWISNWRPRFTRRLEACLRRVELPANTKTEVDSVVKQA